MIARYIQQKYKSGAEIAQAMCDLVLPTITMLPRFPTPATPGDPVDQEALYIWKEETQEKKTQAIQIEESKKRAYALVLGQCSPELESKIKGATNYSMINTLQDIVELLQLIRGYCCDFRAHQQSMWALEQAKHCIPTYYQRHEMTNTNYVEFFTMPIRVVETYG
jgi:hypothetical protein